MPIISAVGRLVGPAFMCFQESTDRLPVTKMIFSASNVIAICSESGKLNKSLIEYWIREVLNRVTSTQFLFSVDQWSPQADIKTYEGNLTKGQSCKLMMVPRKTTSTKQLCGVYFFRQWKELTKRMYRRVSLDQLRADLRSRDAIIKLHTLVHNQLSSSSPVFRPMMSFSWSKCGYIPQVYENFSNVIGVCFSFAAHNCSDANCGEDAFICCSHCQKILCFEHFFLLPYHLH